jgi:hypothetical protein
VSSTLIRSHAATVSRVMNSNEHTMPASPIRTASTDGRGAAAVWIRRGTRCWIGTKFVTRSTLS